MTVVDFRSGGYRDAHDHARAGDRPQIHIQGYAEDGWQDDDWDEARYATAQPQRLADRDSVLGRMARLGHYLGAVISVLLMLSLGIWGYKLVVRDVSGVPVIRAVEGDARIAPENPGGELSERTGLAVNEVAAGKGSGPAQQVALAPSPTGLDGQDVPMGQLGASARNAAVQPDEPVPAEEAQTVALTDSELAARAKAEAAAAQAAADEAAALEQRTASVDPTVAADASAEAAGTADAGQPTTDSAINAALVEAGAVPAVTTPTRPLPRPRRIAAAAGAVIMPEAAPQVADAAVAAESEPVRLATRAEEQPKTASKAEPAPAPEARAEPEARLEPAPVASGATLVQIGAFDSDAIASSEWSRVSGRYGSLFSGKAPVVQKHQANGRTFYRLRVAGFASRDEARKFCAALIAAGTDCIPAVAK